MKKNIQAVWFILAVFYLASCTSNATVFVPVGEQFVLGEYKKGSYSARITNLSKEEVKVSVVDKKTNEQTQGFGLPKGNNAKVYISGSEKVLLKNFSDSILKIKVKLSETVQGMSYQPLPEEK
jgi:hypothetical protein